MFFSDVLMPFFTMIRKEARRTFRRWMMSLLPSAITTVLYYIIFGHVIGSRVGSIGGFSYIEFIAPGMIMMQVIRTSYVGTSSAFFIAKFHRSIEEILVSPVKNYLIVLGYMFGGVLRGMIVGLITLIITLFFTHIHVHLYIIVFLSAFLASSIFALAGFIGALFSDSFEQVSIVPIFILTPMTYLGGVFYSVEMLPTFWQKVSYANPILYMVNSFRYGFLRLTDSHLLGSFLFMILLMVILFLSAIYFLKNASSLRH